MSPADNSGCACCSTNSTAVVSTPAVPAEAAGMRYGVEGLTCGHCVNTVETAVSSVTGVESATVELVTSGISALSVTDGASREAVQAAVESAGYSLTGN